VQADELEPPQSLQPEPAANSAKTKTPNLDQMKAMLQEGQP
jgi:hypothetical protein